MKNEIKNIPVRDNAAFFVAESEQGRIQIEGSGDINMAVSIDGEHFIDVEHSVKFNEGVAIAPFEFCKGDVIRITADILNRILINYN